MDVDKLDAILFPPEGEISQENSDLSVTNAKSYESSFLNSETKIEPETMTPEEALRESHEHIKFEETEIKTPISTGPTEKEGEKITNQRVPTVNAEEVRDINVVAGNIYNKVYYKDSDKNKTENTEEAFGDPTQPLPGNSSNLAAFHSIEDLNKYRKKWDENRLLLLGGMNESILLSTAYQLMDSLQYNTYEKRHLDFDGCNSGRTDLKIDMFRKHHIGRGEKMIILIDIDDQSEFYDSIFKSRTSAQSIKEYLEKKDILLIAIITDDLLKGVEGADGKGFHFSYWKVDFLYHLLKNFFPENTEFLEEKILQQREKDLWGDKNDNNAFHNNVFAELKRGKDSFLEEVNKRQKFIDTPQNPHDSFEDFWKIRTRDVFKDFEPHKTVLYCGTFFPKLPPLDFDKMVRLLLNGKITTTNKTVKMINDAGWDKTIETNGQKETVDIWIENSDKILKECKLKVIMDDNASQYIGFSQPYLENDLKKFFLEDQPMYLGHQFRPIQESGIFFIPDVSPNISNHIVRLVAQMAILNPAYYGIEWLKDFIRQLRDSFDIRNSIDESPEAAVFRFIENTKNKIIRRHFYTQISKLTREMLNYPQLKLVIKNFLNHLFTIDAHDAVLHIVLNVGERMFPTRRSEFDMFYWLRRLLDQGPEDIKEETYEALHQFAIKHHQDIYIVMESVMEWVPYPDKKNTNTSPSNQFSLLFILHYSYGALIRIKEKHYGHWPSNYPLFRPLYKDKSYLEKLKKIIRWLLHPHIQKITKDNKTLIHSAELTDDESNFDLFAFIAEILEGWGMILMGWDYETGIPEAVDLLRTLTDDIISMTNLVQQKSILKNLTTRCIHYKDQFILIKDKKSEKRKKIMGRYKMLYMLIGLCKRLITAQEGVSKQGILSNRRLTNEHQS
ncbi:MAG: hypothetical protein ACM3SY_07200 [Candidatus Omnitrophota bacterium]